MTQQKRTFKKQAPAQLLEQGKLPPQAVDLEEVVLGALMIDSSALNTVIDLLKEEMFYKTAHQVIFAAIISLYKKDEPIDILTVVQELKKEGKLEEAQGAAYVTQLTNHIASAANIEGHTRIIQEQYIKRTLIRQAQEILSECYSDSEDVFTLIDKSQTILNEVTSEIIRNKEKNTAVLVNEFLAHIVTAAKKEISGIPTTLKELNDSTGGWQKTDLIIVAGRPGSGKSAFIKPAIKGAISNLKAPVLVFSLEMSSLQFMARLISEDTNIAAQSYLTGGYKYSIEYDKVEQATRNYYGDDGRSLLIIDDTPALTINELKARAKRVYSEHGICLIVIDYLQLISPDRKNGRHDNRATEVGDISRNLKILAKELDVPVIALSQLSRQVEIDGGDMRPKLSHLRESGSIEQDADIVIFMYRPEYYAEMGFDKFKLIEIDGVEMDSKGYAEAMIAKHRNGALKTIPLKFTSEFTKFENWQTPNPYAQPVTQDF